MSDLGRSLPVLVAMTGVVWVAPLLAVPILGCMALPVAFPALFTLAFGPLLGFRRGGMAGAAGALCLLAGGFGTAVFTMVVLTHVQTVLLGRSSSLPVVEPDLVGWGFVVWGVLAIGAGLTRAGMLEAVGFATAFLAIAPLAAGVLALYASFGLPLGA